MPNGLKHCITDALFADRMVRLLIRMPLFERDWRAPLKREAGIEQWLDTIPALEELPS